MAYQITYAKHGVADPSRLAATTGGAHIYDLQATADRDNGSIVGVGDFVAGQTFKEADATTFTGVITGTAANGNIIITVLTAVNAFLVASVPMIHDQSSYEAQDEANFYNAKGDLMRAYQLIPYDQFAVSASAISGTVADGASVKVTSKKITIETTQSGN